MRNQSFKKLFQQTCCVFLALTSVSAVFSSDILSDNFPPIYVVQRACSSVKIDGKLDEECWAKVPSMDFLEIQHGTPPPWTCYGKMLWDDEYFYIGIYIEDPDVWAVLEPGMPEPKPGDNANTYIMSNDGFGKIFFDPEGDGQNYVEVHVNALNKVDDGYLAYPYLIKGKEHGWKVDWDFKGLITAVFVDGTINDQSTFDKGWSLEVAFPWASLRPLMKGSCPPEYGDTWRAHIGRVWKRHAGASNYYFTWPVLGFVDCHIPSRWGYITFAKEFPELDYR